MACLGASRVEPRREGGGREVGLRDERGRGGSEKGRDKGGGDKECFALVASLSAARARPELPAAQRPRKSPQAGRRTGSCRARARPRERQRAEEESREEGGLCEVGGWCRGRGEGHSLYSTEEEEEGRRRLRLVKRGCVCFRRAEGGGEGPRDSSSAAQAGHTSGCGGSSL